MSDIVGRLRKPVYCEDLMRRWDRWRKQHKEGFAGSATRDEFESIIDGIDEERAEAAAEIERLRAERDEAIRLRRAAEALSVRNDEEFDALQARLAEAVEVVRTVDAFITNGVELGFIRMPDADVPDPAHQTPILVRAFLAKLEGRSGE